MSRVQLIRPGMFGMAAAADARRGEFDTSNETLLAHKIPVDFVFIGDSITHSWDVQAYFGRGSQFIVNRGISGDISSHVLRRFEADVVQLKPRFVVIKIGINNFWAVDAWTEEGRKTPEEISQGIVDDIRGMAKMAQDAGIVPVICSILPTNMPFSGHDHLRNQGVKLTNSALAKVAEAFGGIYVDYHAHLVDESGAKLRDGLADDGLHPHVVGYDIMANVLRGTLASVGVTI